MPVDLRVVRALAIVVVEKQSDNRDNQHHRRQQSRAAAPSDSQAPSALLSLQAHLQRIGRAFVAFSGPTSISMLIVPSLRVNLFHLSNRTRIVRARLIETVKRRNLIVVRARQRILRLDHFNIVRHTRLEAVPRLIHFFFRKLHAQIRHRHLVPRRIQIDQRRLHIQRDLISQVVFLLL